MSDAAPQRPAPNCPFYAHHVVMTRPGRNGTMIPCLTLVRNNSNQCGLEIDRIAPCVLAVEQKPVEWRGCPVFREHLITWEGH
mgnify:CR=1 FL=1